jgi:hypothetical protein
MASHISAAFDPQLYWGTIEDCLVEIHGMKRREAQQRLSAFRLELEVLPPGVNPDFIYHAEQFDVACDLAGRQLDQAPHQDAYDRIVLRYYGISGGERSQDAPVGHRMHEDASSHAAPDLPRDASRHL